MNKTIIQTLIKKPPQTDKDAYIFVCDRKDICEAIITVGYKSMYIGAATSEYFYTTETAVDFVRDAANSGTYIRDYTFVLACLRKKSNDSIEDSLKLQMLTYRQGAYTLFKDREYLGKYDRQDQLESILDEYIKRFEGPETGEIDRGQFHLYADSGSVKGVYEYRIVKYLMETLNMFVVNKELYLYEYGVYRPDEDGIRIKAVAQGLIYDKLISSRVLNSIYNLLIEQQEIQKSFSDLNAYPEYWINFKNGMYDPKEKKLMKHKPEYLSTNQIPHRLKSNADGSTVYTFLSTAIPDSDDREMLLQYIGYCMTRDTGFQRFMIIKGSGGTGKSRIINLIQNIVGKDNYCNVSMQDLNQKFYPSLMYGKLLNSCADISSDALNSVDTIKKATGEDILLYEKKGKDPKSFSSYAKLLFSANKIPLNLDEKSNAFYRRLLILEMNVKPEKIDRDLDDKLLKEIDWVILSAVQSLYGLYCNGDFTESGGSRRLVEELHRAADTVKAFMDECTEKKDDEKINRTMLYEKYVEYCKSYGRKELNANSFYRELEEKGYSLKRQSDQRYVMGVGFRDEGFVPVSEQEAAGIFKNDRL